VTELALNHDQWHPFTRQLDRVRVPELMRRGPATHTRCGGGPAQVRASGGARPHSAAGRTIDDAEQRTDGQLESPLQPRLQFLLSPRVHTHLAAASAFAATDEQRAAAVVEIGFGERERFLNAQPCAPQNDDQPAKPAAVWAIAGSAHDGDDLLHLGWISRVAQTLVAWRAAGVESRHRRGRSTSTSRFEQQLGHDPSSGSWANPRIKAPGHI
jgi:hypothetical protein